MDKNKLKGTGGLLSLPDERDFKWSNLGSSALPFNWNLGYDVTNKLPSYLKIKNQGQSLSCGGQSMAYYGEVLEAISTKSEEERSAKFIYAQTHVYGGGSYLRDNCDIAVKQGWARESVLTSYQGNNTPTEAFITDDRDITPEARNDASISKALSYASVDLNIDAVAQAVANNYGAIILIQGSNNGTWLSAYPKVPVNGEATWNHFLYIGKAKLIDGKKYLCALNSWGPDVGLNGWQWISEDFFTSGRILEVRTLVFKDKPSQFVFNNNLFWGMKNAEVLQLQARLNVIQTGFFGSLTFNAVRKYQQANGISSTGFVGPLTRAKLNSL